VITAYRRVYYGAPAAGKAGPSVMAIAELLAEMGRHLNDDKALRSAIGEYKFLRREYPGSRDRFDALFAIAQIYQDDLHDPTQAKPVFEEFVRRYPHHHLAEAARKALSEPLQQAVMRSKDADQKDSDDDSNDSLKGRAGKEIAGNGVKSTGTENAPTVDSESLEGRQKLSRVINIRRWSNPNYTRIAVDLDKEVKFESQRIDHPERIFFDLLDTNLASSLLGKTMDVDDGMLRKIRVAQFQPKKARIVLEVADRSDYDTFLLSDPPRLIIDIHDIDVPSRDSHGKNIRSRQPVQGASLKEPEAVKPEDSKIANGPGTADSTGSSTVDAKLPLKAKDTDQRPAQLARIAGGTGPKKTIVEAEGDDGNDTGGLTVAKLDPPEIKPTPNSSSTLTLPLSAKNSPKSRRKTAASFPDVREAMPTASGDRSLIRALGLKIGKIVIDPGHGGHDTGTIGPRGLEEKDLVLDVGRRLGKLLQTRLGADVVYTRKDDTFIPLETRTSIANQEQADLFVSIHANSSPDQDARGVETYYLNFTSSAEALDVAARENAASDKSIHELQDLVKKIALKEKIEESREFAANVQRSLHTGLAAKNPGIRDRGVKKAPFIVLIGANMPSILAEISFVSNPSDERKLRTPEYRQRIAESLYRGISKYVSGLSGVKLASKVSKEEGQ